MKYFKNVIKSWEEWQLLVLNPIKDFFGEKIPEFLDDTKSFYTQNQIYILFSQNYGNMIVRYSTKDDFVSQLKLVYIDRIPKLFVATLAFANNEFQKLLLEENRGDKTTEGVESISKQKMKQGIPPSNLKVVSDLSDLNIKNAEYLENAIKDNHFSQYTNLLTNLKQIISSNVSGVILDWLKGFSFLFTSLLTDEFDWNKKLTDILYDLDKNMQMINENYAEIDNKLQKFDELLNSNTEGDENLVKVVAGQTTQIENINNDLQDTKNKIEEFKTQNNQVVEGLNNTISEINNKFSDYVKLTDSQSIQGVKTFESYPVINSTENPPSEKSIVNRKYVDNAVANVAELSNFDFSKDDQVDIVQGKSFGVNAQGAYAGQSLENNFVVRPDFTSTNTKIIYENLDESTIDDDTLITKKYVDNLITNGNGDVASTNYVNEKFSQLQNEITTLKYFDTTINYTRDFLGNPNSDIGVIFTVIEIADKGYTDRDILFIETKISNLAAGRQQRRYSVLQIGTDNSLLYVGGRPSDGSMDVGKSIRIYYR